MKMLMIVKLPHDPFNAAIKDGTAGAKMNAVLDAVKPEAVYFTTMDGYRVVVAVVEMEKSSMAPALAEPWFLSFNAEVRFHIAMGPEDLQQAGLEEIGRKWR